MFAKILKRPREVDAALVEVGSIQATADNVGIVKSTGGVAQGGKAGECAKETLEVSIDKTSGWEAIGKWEVPVWEEVIPTEFGPVV